MIEKRSRPGQKHTKGAALSSIQKILCSLTMSTRHTRNFPARIPIAIIYLAALIISPSHPRAEALKLTSLGSTIESHNDKSTDAIVDRDSILQDIDLSSLACSPSDDAGGSSSSPATCSSNYGVDRSFPIHHAAYAAEAAKEVFYKDFMEGCREKYGIEGFRCDDSEMERMEMNLRQPASMHGFYHSAIVLTIISAFTRKISNPKNYTTLGFHKVRAPASMMNLLSKFWNNKQFSSVTNIPNETWPPGNTYTNHWSSPTKMLNVDSPIRRAIWDASKEILEEWTGVELSQSSLYGVRVYTEGAVLAPHVDRMPLVISAIVNVAQDVDEPWPIEVYGHDGNAYNITMEVGDMIFYESHSVIHGRPFPLNGRYYANVFVHFEPLGHTLQHEEINQEDEQSLEYLYEQAWKKLQSKCSDDEECQARVDLNIVKKVPHYIRPGSEEEMRWLQTHPKARLDTSKDNDWVKSLNAHTAASTGDLDALIAIAVDNPDALKFKDGNGWNPLHEAVRGGHIDIVKFLLKSGLDKDERTHTGTGGTPLWWAKKTHGLDHPMVKYLELIGAKDIPPAGHKKIEDE
ncbi:hypothetical protein ACHAXR_006158 [Thalassiosira sp. AJA248-18]